MGLLISLSKILILVSFILFTNNVYAEYYLYSEYDMPIGEIIYIDCKNNRCNWHAHHKIKRHYTTYHHRIKNVYRYCNQDLATGDDNPCKHPDLQINY